VLICSAVGAFPSRREKSESSDEDYAHRAHKKKSHIKASFRDTPDSGFADSDTAWRRGAAKKVTTYNEAEADYGLDSEEDAIYDDEDGAGGAGAGKFCSRPCADRQGMKKRTRLIRCYHTVGMKRGRMTRSIYPKRT
jgi:hypothetical protein